MASMASILKHHLFSLTAITNICIWVILTILSMIVGVTVITTIILPINLYVIIFVGSYFFLNFGLYLFILYRSVAQYRDIIEVNFVTRIITVLLAIWFLTPMVVIFLFKRQVIENNIYFKLKKLKRFY